MNIFVVHPINRTFDRKRGAPYFFLRQSSYIWKTHFYYTLPDLKRAFVLEFISLNLCYSLLRKVEKMAIYNSIIVVYPEEWQEIRYVKKLVDDIYNSKVYQSLGLYTLELTRRFNNSFRLFEINEDRKHFHQLLVIAMNLAKRLEKGQF